MISPVVEVLHQHKRGKAVGVYSVCSAHPQVLASAARLAAQRSGLLLVESTCNQVNHQGGYMGMEPEQFASYTAGIAESVHLPTGRLVLGGDHLGPFPWKHLPAEQAMREARLMVEAYVMAGYTKIHLDTSMPCVDDPPGLEFPVEVIAQRAAELCQVAENARTRLSPDHLSLSYVIGTEVPTPGGVETGHESIQVTQVESAQTTIEATRRAFNNLGLQGAWERVVAVVVQPGVEFGDQVVFPYLRTRVANLKRFIEGEPGLVFEAHSTDYQSPEALKQLVEDHFAILKVGPGLTFAYREAVFALASIECELLEGDGKERLSRLPEILEQVMLEKPAFWRPYYHGNASDLRVARKYSYSDRARYYWTDPRLQQALNQLFMNLSSRPIPETLISQFMPQQYARLRLGELEATPQSLVADRINEALQPYLLACGYT